MNLLVPAVLTCATLVAQVSIRVTPARIPAEPNGVAWWVKIEFEPVHKTIRGIPIGRLDPSWEFASELMKGGIPKSAFSEDGVDAMAVDHLEFSKRGDFDGCGKQELALVGVFKKSSGEIGNFLLILKKGSKGNWIKFYLQSWGDRPGFLAFPQNRPGLEIWSCMDCEGVSYLDWNAKIKGFTWRKVEGDDE